VQEGSKNKERISNKFHPHPAQSPDLNPIENVWQIVKAIVANYPITKSVEELEEQVLKAWRSVRPETVRNLIESMPRRVQAVVQAKGGHTKY
jgi:transposase